MKSIDDFVEDELRKHKELVEKSTSLELLVFIMALNRLQTRLYEVLMIKLAEEAAKIKQQFSSGNGGGSSGK